MKKISKIENWLYKALGIFLSIITFGYINAFTNDYFYHRQEYLNRKFIIRALINKDVKMNEKIIGSKTEN